MTARECAKVDLTRSRNEAVSKAEQQRCDLETKLKELDAELILIKKQSVDAALRSSQEMSKLTLESSDATASYIRDKEKLAGRISELEEENMRLREAKNPSVLGRETVLNNICHVPPQSTFDSSLIAPPSRQIIKAMLNHHQRETAVRLFRVCLKHGLQFACLRAIHTLRINATIDKAAAATTEWHVRWRLWRCRKLRLRRQPR